MDYFVDKHSVVREIWGKADIILVIFAGASAEFSLNKAVDWLYFTGKLPTDPLGRLFSTVSYARAIVFSEKETALQSIERITAIHALVEENRGQKIPDWAYRDVLFMLIDYSIRSFEILERKLSQEEKREVFAVFYRVGKQMGLNDLPETLQAWQVMRQEHLDRNFEYSHYTKDLYQQYRKHLGPVRYRLLLEVQKLVLPKKALELLQFRRKSILTPFPGLYKLFKKFQLDKLIKFLILPPKYKNDFRKLEGVSN